jgi:hypothetical protein
MQITLSDIVSKNEKNEILIINNNANENILFIGSCRIIAFVNYFYNDDFFGKKYNYIVILAHVTSELSKTIDTNEYIKSLIFNSKILVAEYLVSFNYINTSRQSEKNIFQIYDNFDLYISLPNYQDILSYTEDIIQFNEPCRNYYKLYITNNITLIEFSNKLKDYRDSEINRYSKIIDKTEFKDLSTFVLENYKNIRLAFSLNHPTNNLLIEMYRILLHKFFNRTIPESVIQINKDSFLGGVPGQQKLTYYDKFCLDYNINENYLSKEESDKYLSNF